MMADRPVADRPLEGIGWCNRSLSVRYCGLVGYPEALALQAELVARRRSGEIPDTLLLLQHPHVITLGSASHAEHLLLSSDELSAKRIGVYQAGRGGDVTYHGPGQLVGYPILDLKPDRQDLHAYLRSLERAIVRALQTLGIDGQRDPAGTGVWVAGAKVAAIGIRVSSGWITSHGFALNADPDLSYFDVIVPCGLHGRAVTSLSRLLGRRVSAEDCVPAVVAAMAREFGYGTVDDPEARYGWRLEEPFPGGANSK
ncbi:MAG: lipoyl(octanoyl) transferase LipB [Gemmatimonadota bacterium]|nr:lipoyl(octanoyl) transferase LipB [Gemmatimonadota bacterium]